MFVEEQQKVLSSEVLEVFKLHQIWCRRCMRVNDASEISEGNVVNCGEINKDGQEKSGKVTEPRVDPKHDNERVGRGGGEKKPFFSKEASFFE